MGVANLEASFLETRFLFTWCDRVFNMFLFTSLISRHELTISRPMDSNLFEIPYKAWSNKSPPKQEMEWSHVCYNILDIGLANWYGAYALQAELHTICLIACFFFARPKKLHDHRLESHGPPRVKIAYLRFCHCWYLHNSCMWIWKVSKLYTENIWPQNVAWPHHATRIIPLKNQKVKVGTGDLGSSPTTRTAPWRFPTHSWCHCSTGVVSQLGCQLADLGSSHTWCWKNVPKHLEG